MLFKFYFKRSMEVDRVFDHRPYGGQLGSYQDEKFAFSEEHYFTDLDKAKAFAQLHTPIPLVWDDNSEGYGYYNAVVGPKSDCLDFMISIQAGTINPVAPLPIPAEAELQFHDRDPD